jgi:hypothetical protein
VSYDKLTARGASLADVDAIALARHALGDLVKSAT